MKKIYDFLCKYALAINIALFVLSFVLYFLPLNVIDSKLIEFGVSGYSAIWHTVRDSIITPYHNGEYIAVYLCFFIILWLFQIASIVLYKKMPLLSCLPTIPLTVIFFFTIYIFANSNAIPHIGFFVMLILYCLYIFQSIIMISIKFPKRVAHKPTDKERIAELERQVEELRKEKDAE